MATTSTPRMLAANDWLAANDLTEHDLITLLIRDGAPPLIELNGKLFIHSRDAADWLASRRAEAFARKAGLQATA